MAFRHFARASEHALLPSLLFTVLGAPKAWAAPPLDPSPTAEADALEGSEAHAPEPSEGHSPEASEPASGKDSEGEAPDEDLSELLAQGGDEVEAPARVRVAPAERSGVDRHERLRSYYAKIYRPEHNPSRIYFSARAAYALAGTSESVGGGGMGFFNAELGQTWNFIGYGVNATLMAGSLTYGDAGVELYSPILVGGGPSLGLGRLGLFGRGYLDLRVGYNFFYAPVIATRAGFADPPDAAPHGPKVQVDVGLLLHDSESRRFRHGLGASIGWQMLVGSFAGDFPIINTFNVGFHYFFG